MNPDRKISDEMRKRRARQLARRPAPARRPLPHEAVCVGDGHDAARIERAEMKRQARRIRNLVRV